MLFSKGESDKDIQELTDSRRIGKRKPRKPGEVTWIAAPRMVNDGANIPFDTAKVAAQLLSNRLVEELLSTLKPVFVFDAKLDSNHDHLVPLKSLSNTKTPEMFPNRCHLYPPPKMGFQRQNSKEKEGCV